MATGVKQKSVAKPSAKASTAKKTTAKKAVASVKKSTAKKTATKPSAQPKGQKRGVAAKADLVKKSTTKKASKTAKSEEAKPKQSVARALERKAKGERRKKVLDRYAEQGAKIVEMRDGGAEWPEVAQKAKVSVGKARRLYAMAKVPAKLRISGTPDEVGKEIVRLRDDEGLPFMPDIWSRLGAQYGPGKIKKLYEKASGKPWRKSGNKSKVEKTKETKGKSGKKGRAGKSPKAGGERKLKGKFRDILEKVWNLDTPEDELMELLRGRTLEVTRTVDERPIKPVEYRVKVVKSIAASKSDGNRVIDFIDSDQKERVINTRWITNVK